MFTGFDTIDERDEHRTTARAELLLLLYLCPRE